MTESEKGKNGKGRLVPITVRFTVGGIEAISDVAQRNHMTKAEIVRLAVDNRLSSYLGNLVYVDDKKAEMIKKEISDLGTTLERIRYELNRIGVNYNQEMKLKNIEKKYRKYTDYEYLKTKQREINQVRSETLNITADDLNTIMKRYENALMRASAILGSLLK